MVTNINYEKLAEKMYSLYITKNYPFIKQHTDGTYEWCYKYGNLENKGYQILVKHLQRKQTVGVFSHSHTKFICFDLDFKDSKELVRWYGLKIINVLEEFGINRDYIYVSNSGKKGVHIEIFFDNIVSYKQIEFLYDLVLEEIYYETDEENLKVYTNHNISLEELKQNIELRPKSNIGVKLPLSIHQVTKNVCYYCDNVTFEPIKSIEYILEIKQIPRDYIDYAIERGLEFRKDRNNIKCFNKEIKPYVKPVNTQKLFNDEEYTIEYIENLINNGLQIQGSRHNSLMKIARYYYHFNYNIEQCEGLMIEWMHRQDKRFYNSNEIEWKRDIKEIVRYVYKEGKGLIGVTRDISINKEEMMEILKLNERKKKLLFYAFIIHCKRYSLINGSFYMTYAQIEESCGVSHNTAKKYIEQLRDEKEINILRQNENRNYGYKKLPNMYQMTNSKIRLNNNKCNEEYIVKKEVSDLDKEFNNTVINLFSKKELRHLIPDKQYRDIAKLYVS